MKPETVAVAEEEGGEWIPFDEFEGHQVHAIKFENGWIWDVINGWREEAV